MGKRWWRIICCRLWIKLKIHCARERGEREEEEIEIVWHGARNAAMVVVNAAVSET